MEKLIEELKTQIAVMNKNNGNKYDLSDTFLDKLYSVFPFNKFEKMATAIPRALDGGSRLPKA